MRALLTTLVITALLTTARANRVHVCGVVTAVTDDTFLMDTRGGPVTVDIAAAQAAERSIPIYAGLNALVTAEAPPAGGKVTAYSVIRAKGPGAWASFCEY